MTLFAAGGLFFNEWSWDPIFRALSLATGDGSASVTQERPPGVPRTRYTGRCLLERCWAARW